MGQDDGKPDWKAIRDAIKCVLSRRGVPDSDAEDLAQKSAEKMLRSLGGRSLSTPEGIAYAVKTARTVLSDYIRARFRVGDPNENHIDVDRLPCERDISDAAIQEYLYLTLALRNAIAHLGAEDRDVLQAVNRGRGYASALARQRGVHRATVQRQYRRILRSIRQSLIASAKTEPKLAQILAKRGLD